MSLAEEISAYKVPLLAIHIVVCAVALHWPHVM